MTSPEKLRKETARLPPTRLAVVPTKPPRANVRPSLLGLNHAKLVQFLAPLGAKPFRASQIIDGVYRRRKNDFALLRSLPESLREALDERATLLGPTIDKIQTAEDQTRKYRFVSPDGSAYEAVYIPQVAKGRGTNTVCISSQTGCAVGCKFCFTASLVRHRNLSPAEIVGQVMAVQDDVASLGEAARISNVVFMGMGEPLLNYDNVITSARCLLEPNGLNFSSRRVTISTSGIVPRLKTLGRDVPTQVAISLNATTDSVRTAIMPINKKWPIKTLLETLHAFPLARRRRFTIEYVLLGGINDSLEDAKRLTQLLRNLPVKINLLPLNAHERTEFVTPSHAAVLSFQKVLLDNNFNVFCRTARGDQVSAACGQLGGSQKASA